MSPDLVKMDKNIYIYIQVNYIYQRVIQWHIKRMEEGIGPAR